MNALLIVAAVCALFVALLFIVATIRRRSRGPERDGDRSQGE
jgi:hypothetical protein